jgi:DNA-binding NarL/FixJ family response regulator
VVFNGWEKANRIFPREITVAVFWTASPLCCTYTTIYSVPQGIPERWRRKLAPAQRECKVVLVDPEKAVREAVRFWMDRQPGFIVLEEYAGIKEMLESASVNRADLILVDRPLMESRRGTPLVQLRRQLPRANVFGIGVYEESNYIFHSVTGVKSGYILCRRPPTQLFEPVRSLAGNPRVPLSVLETETHNYFKTLFHLETDRNAFSNHNRLTMREQDVLMGLARGFTEKEVAANLQISSFTVHNHVKKIYSKLDVHSRTEAVVKFLHAGLIS